MAISFDQALGIHPEALNYRVQRTKIIASNLANVDTPGYLAKDLSFKTVMDNVAPGKVDSPALHMVSSLMYSMPYQNSTDSNTVEQGVEQAKFTQNSMDFQTSLTFLNMKFHGLSRAIEGR